MKNNLKMLSRKFFSVWKLILVFKCIIFDDINIVLVEVLYKIRKPGR